MVPATVELRHRRQELQATWEVARRAVQKEHRHVVAGRRRQKWKEVLAVAPSVEGRAEVTEVAATRRRTRLPYCFIGNLGLCFCSTDTSLVLEIIRSVVVHLE